MLHCRLCKRANQQSIVICNIYRNSLKGDEQDAISEQIHHNHSLLFALFLPIACSRFPESAKIRLGKGTLGEIIFQMHSVCRGEFSWGLDLRLAGKELPECR